VDSPGFCLFEILENLRGDFPFALDEAFELADKQIVFLDVRFIGPSVFVSGKIASGVIARFSGEFRDCPERLSRRQKKRCQEYFPYGSALHCKEEFRRSDKA
jgi:hypothetical protein